jgi:hypothetical protein
MLMINIKVIFQDRVVLNKNSKRTYIRDINQILCSQIRIASHLLLKVKIIVLLRNKKYIILIVMIINIIIIKINIIELILYHLNKHLIETI